jgi:hypothetical protein
VKKEESYINLYKKIDATSKTRFNASRRLRLHSKFTTFTVVIISLGLILVSLMQAFSLGNNIESKLVGLMQVFSAVAVLVYSLLTDKNDYSNLSEKMYSCASQLGELKQKLYPALDGEHDQEKYDSYRDGYHEVLKLYETHAINDFRGDYFRAKLEMPENYVIKGKDWWVAKAEIYFLHILDFISYPVVLGALGWFICWVWFGTAPTS